MTVKSWLQGINAVGAATQALSKIDIGVVGVNSGNITYYQQAIKGLTAEQAALALATRGANAEQIEEIMTTETATMAKGTYTQADIQAALAKQGLATATSMITAAQQEEIITSGILTSEQMSQIASTLGLQTAEDGSLVSKEALNVAMVKQALTSAGVVGAQQAEILSILGLTTAEVGATTATNLLTGALTKLKAAIVSHPIGAMLVGAAAIIAAVVTIKNSIDDAKEKAEEAIKETHDNAENALNDAKNALSQTKSDLSDVESKLEEVNDQISQIAGKTSISLVDRSEIDKLATTKQLLLEQQSLLKQTAEMQSQNVAAQASALLQTKTDAYKTYAPEGDSPFTGSYTYSEWYNYLMEEMENIYNHQIEYMQNNNTAKLNSLQRNMSLQKGEMYSYISELNSILSSMQNADGSIVKGYESIYKEYSGYLHNMQAYLDPDNFWDLVQGFNITDIDIGGMYEEALKSAYEGNFNIDKVNKDFLDALSEKGIDKDTIDYIFKVKQEQYKDIIENIEKKYPEPQKKDLKPTLTPEEYTKAIDTYFNTTQIVYNIEGEVDEEATEKAQSKAKAIGDRLKQYMKSNPVEFDNFVKFDGAYAKLDQYAQEEYEKVQDWDKAFATAMSRVNLDIKTEGIEDERADAIRTKLLDYAEKNPVEFELIATYDTNFDLLDKYVDEELKHTDDMSEAVNNALDKVKSEMQELGIEDGVSFVVDIEAETDNIEKFNTALEESASATGLTSESIEHLTQKYQGLADFDADKLFERTATGIRLNKTELQNLESEYSNLQKQKNDKWLQTLLTRYKDLETQISEETDAQERANLLAQRNSLYNQIQEAGELASMYDGLTSAFNKWQEAQDGAEAGDTYDTIRDGLEDIQELYDKGLVGQDEFRTYVDLLSSKDLSAASVDEVVAAWENLGNNIEGTSYSIKDFLKEDEIGVSNFLKAVQDVNSEWAKQKDDGSWEINFGEGNDEEVAKKLGTTTEFVQSMLQKLKDYGFDIEIDGAYTSLEKLESQADKANQKLIKLGKTNITFDFGGVDLQTVNGEIDKAKSMLEQFKKADGTIDLSIEGASEAQSILATLIYQKQQLDDSSIIKVDTSQLKGKISKAVGWLQDFKTNYNTLEVETSIGADSSETEKQIGTVVKKIDKIPKSIQTKLGLDDEDFTNAVKNIKADIKAGVTPKQEDLDKINNKISKITPKMMVEAGVDSKAIDGYEPEEKTTTITYTSPDGKTIQQYQTDIDKWKPSDKTAKITYIKTTKGSSKADGTAHAFGTAYAGGNWGTKNSGVALGGEEKPEILVRNGKWHIIGQKSAEMFHYKKGDIIFNGNQSEQILKYGKITSGQKRGKSYAGGTAFSKGSGSFGNVQHDDSSSNNNNSSNNSSSSSSSSSSSEDKLLTKFQNWFDKLFDWIEIKLERQTKRIDRYISKAENASDNNSYGTAASNYRKAIGATATQIGNENAAVSKYTSQANKTINKAVSIGIISKKQAKSIKNKVANGTMDISKYGDRVQEVISSYQEWYDKAQDAKDALEELHANIRTYINDLKDLRDAQRDAKIDRADTYATIATSGYTSQSGKYSSAANSQLGYSNTSIDKENSAYATATTKAASDRNSLGSAAKSQINKQLKKKNLKKVNKKKRAKYKKALKNAKNAIKKKKAVSNSDLKVIRSVNKSLYTRLYAYNLSLENLEIARLEQATAYAENSAEKAENKASKYENLDTATSNKQDLAQQRADNATNAADANRYLAQVAAGYDTILSNDQAEINTFKSDKNKNRNILIANNRSNKKHHGKNYATLSKSMKKKVDKYIDKAQKAAKNNTIIPSDVIAKLAEFYSKGYITAKFYKACIDYNNALEHLREAEAQKEIDEETAKAEKAAIGTQMVSNVEKEYENKLNENKAKTTAIQTAQNLATTRGVALTAEDYQNLISQSIIDQQLYQQEAQAVYDQIMQNIASGYWTTDSQEYKDAMDAYYGYQNSAEECRISQEEWNNAIANLPFDNLEKLLGLLDSFKNRLAGLISMQEKFGLEIDSATYRERLVVAQREAIAARREAERALEYMALAQESADGVYGGKTIAEWKEESEQYLADEYKYLEEVKEISDALVEYYMKPFEDAIKGIDRFKKIVDGYADLLDDDMLYDKDGKLTEYGIAKIATTVENYENARNKISEYEQELTKLNELRNKNMLTAAEFNEQHAVLLEQLHSGIITYEQYLDAYNALGELYNTPILTEEEYAEKLAELQEQILAGAKDMKSAMNEIVDMYKDMAQNELDDLFDLIDARNEALKAKKAYYDYDKSIREKNKNIQELQSELAALQGIDTAAAKAKRAQLMSDLAEAQDELNETVQEHLIEISEDSLDDLKDTLQDAFDEKWEEIKRDLSAQTELWTDASALVSGSVNLVNETLKRLLNYYGVDTSDLPGFASGTTSASKNMMAYLHENGREGIITKKGIIMPLLKGEGVLPADATSRLLAMAKGDMSDFIGLPDISKAGFGSNTPEFNINQDNSITIEGSADAVTVEQLKKLHNDWVKDAADYTDKKIHRDFLKGGGRRTV